MTESITELFGAIWDVWKEMASAFFGVIPTAIHFFLWAISGIIILPCVFVAGSLFPLWMDWGKDF
jgi:ABC-type multidrug transport system permease subunit